MSKFTKNDLAYAGYSNSTDIQNKKNFSVTNEKIVINKTEEYEIIDFCNHFLEKFKLPKTKSSFQKVERLVHNPELENEIYHEDIQEWIATNWIKIR